MLSSKLGDNALSRNHLRRDSKWSVPRNEVALARNREPESAER